MVATLVDGFQMALEVSPTDCYIAKDVKFVRCILPFPQGSGEHPWCCTQESLGDPSLPKSNHENRVPGREAMATIFKVFGI